MLVYTTEFLPLAWVEPSRGGYTLFVQSPQTTYLKKFYFYEYVRERGREWSASIERTRQHLLGGRHQPLGECSLRPWRPPLCGAIMLNNMKMWIGTNRTKTNSLTPAQERFLGRCEFCDAKTQDEVKTTSYATAPPLPL